MNFQNFKTAVAQQFEMLQQHEMFRVELDKDELWSTYLQSFPEGTNPLYRERTVHDCSCCRQFIKAVGNAVAIIDGKLHTVWDLKLKGESEFQAVADSLALFVAGHKISNFFVHPERTAGTDKNFEDLLDGKTKRWDHLFANINSKFFLRGDSIPTHLGEQRSSFDVMGRSLETIDMDSVTAVLELISQNSLYRGEEHKFAVETFGKLKREYLKLKTQDAREYFVWTRLKSTPASVARIRNTSIGTLLVDLSEGRDLEAAVKSFEDKVAPTNYKRPTALITRAMIDKAKSKLEELGLTSALDRRFAVLSDISVNNILFADRSARKNLSGNVFDELADSSPTKVKSLDKVEEVSIDKFIRDVLPNVQSLEVLLENSHESNLVSLVAPADPTAGKLFKWDNRFSWCYNGEVTDSIKERVKKAGGSITGDLLCRLAWDYSDDLDFHMHEPHGGHIFFSNRGRRSSCGGMLDVDANGIDGPRPNPVENIFYANRRDMENGRYDLKVHNYNRRSGGIGFTVEIEFDGQIRQFVYDRIIKHGQTIDVATIKAKGGQFEIVESLPSTTAQKTMWGLPTQVFHRVNVMMLSPNHWDERAVGNKHYMFMLEGCAFEGQARGFFNEFLKEQLDAHRKVFEVVGSKVKTAESADQLSGLGFSSTQKNSLVCRVKGSVTRTLRIVF